MAAICLALLDVCHLSIEENAFVIYPPPWVHPLEIPPRFLEPPPPSSLLPPPLPSSSPICYSFHFNWFFINGVSLGVAVSPVGRPFPADAVVSRILLIGHLAIHLMLFPMLG